MLILAEQTVIIKLCFKNWWKWWKIYSKSIITCLYLTKDTFKLASKTFFIIKYIIINYMDFI